LSCGHSWTANSFAPLSCPSTSPAISVRSLTLFRTRLRSPHIEVSRVPYYSGMHSRLALIGLLLLVLPIPLCAGSSQGKTFLWIVDEGTGLGIPGAEIDIGPGNVCVGKPDNAWVKWTGHYVTGPAGRVQSQPFSDWFSCRVAVNGKQLYVASAGGLQARPWPGPKWLAHPHASEMTLTVQLTPAKTEDDLHYWEHTSDPAQFRAYIEDLDDGKLLSDVTITAVRSGISAITDRNGLFTLDIPARFWKGVSPPGAMETLIFSKDGYKRYEYRDLILSPGMNWLAINLEKGEGTIVRKNGGRGGINTEEFVELKPGEHEKVNPKKGEILSLNIEPAAYEGGWIVCTDENSKAVVKSRNLKSVDIFWYSTGTGIGLMPPAKAGPMKKVSSSGGEDTWEIEMPDLMATNFWAQGTDLSGKAVKSMDLGNVSWALH
jgi:hypothetical protein